MTARQPHESTGTSIPLLTVIPDPAKPGVQGNSAVARRDRLQQSVVIFAEHKMAVTGLVVTVFMILFCFVGPLLYRTNQVAANIVQSVQPPSAAHLLGTDQNGFDIVGRLMIGGQTSLEIGLGSAVLGAVFGTIWGAAAGYLGGIVDTVMMRIVDAVLAIPALLLLLVLATIVEPTVPTLIIIVALTSWMVPARLVRAETLRLKEMEFVQAARIYGSRTSGLLYRHIIPNTMGVIVVNTTFQVANAILLVAYLNFLGLGIPPPATNWGAMLSDGLNYALSGYWWMIYSPGLAIVLTVLAVNYVGDGLRDVFEVRNRRQ